MKFTIKLLFVLIGSWSYAGTSITYITNADQDTIKTDTILPGDINVEQVEVIKAFEATLQEASEVLIKPDMPEIPVIQKKYEYDITIVPIKLNYPEPVIKPFAMKSDPEAVRHNFYTKLGYGNIKSRYAELGVSHIVDDLYNIGLNLYHHAADDSGENELKKYSSTTGKIDFSYRIKENIGIKSDLFFNPSDRYFYSEAIDSIFPEVESQRKVNRFNIGLGLHNLEPTAQGINYEAGGRLYFTKILDEEVSETGGKINVSAQKDITSGSILKVKGDLAFFDDGSNATTTALLKPSLSFRDKKKYWIDLGASFIYNDDSVHPFAEIELGYRIGDAGLNAFIGTTQDYHATTLTEALVENPFVDGNIDSVKVSVTKKYYGGIRGNVKTLSYEVRTGFMTTSDQHFYVNALEDIRKFDIIYDDMNTFFISGNVELPSFSGLTIGGFLSQKIHNTQTLEKAWHLPALEIRPYARLSTMDDKLLVSSELVIRDNIHYFLPDIQDNGNAQFDLSFDLQYKLNKNFGAFVEINNLFDNNYERWYDYPGFGLNVLGGISLKF